MAEKLVLRIRSIGPAVIDLCDRTIADANIDVLLRGAGLNQDAKHLGAVLVFLLDRRDRYLTGK